MLTHKSVKDIHQTKKNLSKIYGCQHLFPPQPLIWKKWLLFKMLIQLDSIWDRRHYFYSKKNSKRIKTPTKEYKYRLVQYKKHAMLELALQILLGVWSTQKIILYNSKWRLKKNHLRQSFLTQVYHIPCTFDFYS